MTEKQSTDDRAQPTAIGRRTFIAVGSGLGATTLAGCASDGSTDGTRTDESTDGTQTEDGTTAGTDGPFRLLISDMPADIGDFDRLDVTLDYARIFDGGENGGDESDGGDSDEDESDDAAANTSDDGNETDGEPEPDRDDGDDDAESDAESDADGAERTRDFYTLDLEGATVDLTEVIGDKAVPVFEGELSPGTYEKIELHVSSVEGVVDGEQATVKVPSEKLQITHPFEVRADEAVDFVFDINVVKRGNGNEYNLKPVISESGVAGKDVDVEEIGDTRDDEDEQRNDGAEPDEGDRESGDGGEPDDETDDSADGADGDENDESDPSDSDDGGNE